MYILRALFQSAIIASPKIEFAMPMPSSELMFWKRTLHKYVHTDAFMKGKTYSMKLVLTLQTHFSNWRLSRFGKELFIYTHIFTYIYIHIYIYRLHTYIHIYLCMCTFVHIPTSRYIIYIYIWLDLEYHICGDVGLSFGKYSSNMLDRHLPWNHLNLHSLC